MGKTADQLEKEQRGEPLFDSNTASLIPSSDIPEAPKPMIELSQNFEPNIITPEPSPTTDNLSSEQSEPLYQKATQDPVEEPIIEPLKDVDVPEETVEESKVQEIDSEEPTPKGSLFERFLKTNPSKQIF